MKLLTVCKGISKIGIDSVAFIYYIEDRNPYSELCQEIFLQIESRLLAGFSSTLALTEVLTHPFRENDLHTIQAYKTLLLGAPGMNLIPIDASIAEKAAELRAKYLIKTPDALQLATAILSGCDAFLTNDKGLRRVSELLIIILDDFID